MIKRDNKGYTLLFAVIVSSIVLSVAAFIISVSRKQVLLATAARDSTMAIYAADSGIQCAVAHYILGKFYYDSSKPANYRIDFYCNGNKVSSNNFSSTPSGSELAELNLSTDTGTYKARKAKFILDSDYVPIGGGCFIITVIDGYSATDLSHRTIIESRGYTTGTNSICPTKSPRQEERAIRLIYSD